MADNTPTPVKRTGEKITQVDPYLSIIKRLGIPTSDTDTLDAAVESPNAAKILYNTTLEQLRVWNPVTETWSGVGGGGSEQNLQQVLDIGSVAEIEDSIVMQANEWGEETVKTGKAVVSPAGFVEISGFTDEEAESFIGVRLTAKSDDDPVTTEFEVGVEEVSTNKPIRGVAGTLPEHLVTKAQLDAGGGGAPSGPAGGDLSGSYPNPNIAEGLIPATIQSLHGVSITDLNNLTTPGWYSHGQGSAPANAPLVRAGQVLVTTNGGGIYTQQEWTGRDDTRKFIRRTDSSGQFENWVELTNQGGTPSTPVRNTSGGTVTISAGDEGGIVHWYGSLYGLSINATAVLSMPIGSEVKVFVASTETDDGDVVVTAPGSDVIGSEATLRENAESGMITIMRFLAEDTIYVSWDGSWEFNGA